MSSPTFAVLAEPTDPRLALLLPALQGARFAVGPTAESLEEILPEADAILCWTAGKKVLEAALAKAPRCRWIQLRIAGLDAVLFPALITNPLQLTNARGVYGPSLAEFTLGAMLHFAKDFSRMKRAQSEGRWDPFEVDVLRGRTLGIIGYGDIGQAVAGLAQAFGMEVLAYRRNAAQSRGDPRVSRLASSMGEVLEAADYLVVSTPLTKETRHLIGAAELAAMKPSAVLVNLGRGAVIDEAALVKALEQKRLRGAALDVFEIEPLPAGHAFFRLENLLLSPHCADHTLTWQDDVMGLFVENVGRFRRGEPLLNVVADKARGY